MVVIVVIIKGGCQKKPFCSCNTCINNKLIHARVQLGANNVDGTMWGIPAPFEGGKNGLLLSYIILCCKLLSNYYLHTNLAFVHESQHHSPLFTQYQSPESRLMIMGKVNEETKEMLLRVHQMVNNVQPHTNSYHSWTSTAVDTFTGPGARWHHQKSTI